MSTCMQAGPHLESRQGVAVSEQTEGLAVRARRQPRVVCARVALHTYAHAEREREREGGEDRERSEQAGVVRSHQLVIRGHQGSSVVRRSAGERKEMLLCGGSEGREGASEEEQRRRRGAARTSSCSTKPSCVRFMPTVRSSTNENTAASCRGMCLYQECAEAAQRTNLAICTPVTHGILRSSRRYSTHSHESPLHVIRRLLCSRGGALGPGAPVSLIGKVRRSSPSHKWSAQ